MKFSQKFTAILAAAFILSGCFPLSAVKAGQIPEDTALTESSADPEDETASVVPQEAPAFHAHIEFRMGYAVIGTFTDFTPDIIRIQTLYSLDGASWQDSGEDWNLFALGTENEYSLSGLQNQPCLLSAHEPLKRYIAGEIDRFYLKLRITKSNGLSYETQSAVIDRGRIQPIPENAERRALFSSAVSARESDPAAPYRYRQYGRYQLTISADATAEEISSLLPDTLPVEVQLDQGPDFIAIGLVDCPITWKPLSLPELSAGESITIADAAEEITVPGGTLISTPVGVFQLDEPLSLDTLPSTDEVRLILNVCPDDRNPTGVLKEDREGLKIALHQKPTGAVSIQAYVLPQGESDWTELSGLSLLKEMNTQPSTENSGYGMLLSRDQEPYRSYLAATDAGTAPTPFFVGLKIQGGIYDGRELILSWPDIYEQLPDLPKIKGAEGNEGNAGAANRDDSTESGQRPHLPSAPEAPSETPKTQEAPSTDAPVSARPREPQESMSDTSAEDPVENHTSASPVVQPAPDIKNGESAAVLSDENTLPEYTAGNTRRPSQLPLALSLAAGICICIAVIRRPAGYSLLCRTVRRVRTIFFR